MGGAFKGRGRCPKHPDPGMGVGLWVEGPNVLPLTCQDATGHLMGEVGQDKDPREPHGQLEQGVGAEGGQVHHQAGRQGGSAAGKRPLSVARCSRACCATQGRLGPAWQEE